MLFEPWTGTFVGKEEDWPGCKQGCYHWLLLLQLLLQLQRLPGPPSSHVDARARPPLVPAPDAGRNLNFWATPPEGSVFLLFLSYSTKLGQVPPLRLTD